VGLTLASCRRSGDEVSSTDGAAGAVGRTAGSTDAGGGVLAPPAEGDASAAVAVEAGAIVAATRRACRVMSLRGDATVLPGQGPARAGAAPGDASASRWLGQGELVPEGAIIRLGAAGTMTLQATVSTREMTFVGPAIAEVCPGGDEAVRLSSGKVTAFPGPGVRPGAEVWVATPLGVVRFNEAQIEIEVPGVEAEHLKVSVITGQATFVPAAGATLVPPREPDAGPLVLAPGTTIAAGRPSAAPARWTRDLVAACVRRASAAREAGQKVARAGQANRTSLGDLAAAHVQSRQLARAACESARAAVVMLLGQIDAALRADLERADESWKALPPASSSARAASSSAPATPTQD
jgi:hypothetical protein